MSEYCGIIHELEVVELVERELLDEACERVLQIRKMDVRCWIDKPLGMTVSKDQSLQSGT